MWEFDSPKVHHSTSLVASGQEQEGECPERSSAAAERSRGANSKSSTNMFYFYFFLCKDGSLYTGTTNYPPQREFRHNSKGAQWTKQHGGGEIVYTETYQTLAEARQREIQVKKWSRIKKDNLIKGLKP